MRSSWLLILAAVLESAVAGNTPSPSPASTQWAEWSTTTVYSTIYYTTTNYITTTGPTTTKTEYQTEYKTVVDTQYISVTGPTTTVTNVVTSTETSQVTVTQTSAVTVTETNQVTTTEAPVTVTSIQTIPQTIVQTVSQTVEETVRETQTVSSEITAVITTISQVTVSASTSCPSILSGLVTCPSRIINPTYTPAAPLPSNYLWGCPPGSICHPPRINCNFEQNLPADTYVCAPEECQPIAELPPLNAFLGANPFNNGSCAFLTPADDYFNINPLFLGLDFGIFNIYGQATCTATSTCPAARTVTIVPTGTTYTALPAGSTWHGWTGPTPSPATGSPSSAAPQVTKRAELSHLAKRQGQPLIGYSSCYAQCDYAAYVWQSIGNDPPVLCDPNGDWYSAYKAATDCNNDYAATDGSGPSRIVSELNPPRSICSNLLKRNIFGRKV